MNRIPFRLLKKAMNGKEFSYENDSGRPIFLKGFPKQGSNVVEENEDGDQRDVYVWWTTEIRYLGVMYTVYVYPTIDTDMLPEYEDVAYSVIEHDGYVFNDETLFIVDKKNKVKNYPKEAM